METPTQLVVYGAGGHGKVVADLALRCGHSIEGFVDDAVAAGTRVLGLPVLGASSWLESRAGSALSIALGVGDNRARQEVYERCLKLGFKMPSLVHPTAAVAPSAKLGAGAVVMASAVVNADASVGEGAIINSGAIVEHDCEVGPFAHLSPNCALGGSARVGALSHVGLCAAVLPGIEVGEGTVVGAGAVVSCALPPGVVAAGVPARVLRHLEANR